MYLEAAVARIRAAALFSIDTLLTMTAKGTLRPDRVLIIRLDAIGDFVLWLDAAQALAEHYRASGKSTVLVANATWAAWARDLAIFDEVIVIDVRKFLRTPLYRLRMGRTIRASRSTTAVNPTYSRDWLLDDSVIRICAATERIGSVGDGSNLRSWQMRIANRWYTKLIPADPEPCMELERNAEFMRNMGESTFRAKLPNLNTQTAPPTDNPLTAEIADGSPYYVLFPGASRGGKQWPIQGFVEIAENLYKQTGWHGIVCGGKSDVELSERLVQLSAVPLFNWAGRTDLPQLAAILSASRLLLTNDTSAAHIGPACGVPTLCILGGGHYGRFMPYKIDQETERPLPRAIIHQMPCFGCNWQCIYECSPQQPVPCIERIQPADVWHAISEMLGFAP